MIGVDPRGRPSFAEETLPILSIGTEFGSEYLEGNSTMKSNLLRFEDITHTPDADQTKNTIVSQSTDLIRLKRGSEKRI
jgi:hypothetical protein